MVLPAFSRNVPSALRSKFPLAQISHLRNWNESWIKYYLTYYPRYGFNIAILSLLIIVIWEVPYLPFFGTMAAGHVLFCPLGDLDIYHWQCSVRVCVLLYQLSSFVFYDEPTYVDDVFIDKSKFWNVLSVISTKLLWSVI